VRRQFDRRVAAKAFAVAAVSLFVTFGFAAPPGVIGSSGGRSAVGDLVALMRAGERGSWSVTYQFTRTLAGGRALRQSMQEARSPAMHVLLAGTSMSVVEGDRSYDCTVADDRPACTESAAGTSLPPSEVLRVAVATGAYSVTAAPDATIAGERARCFRVVATGPGQLPDLGIEADLCLGPSGVSLRQRIVHASGDVDERLAESVAQPVTTAAVRAVARGFDPAAARNADRKTAPTGG
jgi:hypothetical protein